MSAEIYVIWPGCVYIGIERKKPERITGPSVALETLERRWPQVRGHHYYTAKAACLAALNWKCSSVVARKAFIAAAIEAEILVSLT